MVGYTSIPMQHFSKARHHRTATFAALFALLGCVAAVSACQSESAKKADTAAAGTTAKAAPAQKPAALPSTKPTPPPAKRLEWDDPKQWKKIPASGMRVGSYQIPPAPGDKEIAELNVFALGGDIESNIQRWVDEFSGFDPKTLARADRSVNDLTEAVVEIPKGRFNGGMGEGAESENFGLLGAIVVTPEDVKYFFKLTGPSATVQAARAPFYALLDSVRMEGGSAAPATAKTIKTIAGPAAPAGVAPSGTPPSPAKVDHPANAAPAASPPAKH
jgi:hypothetical protein